MIDRNLQDVSTSVAAVLKLTLAVDAQLEKFKTFDVTTYTKIHGYEYRTQIFETLAALEMLLWDPFTEGQLASQQWYRILFANTERWMSQQLSQRDPDENCIPSLIAKYALPA
uniref:tRNA dimethylallyltransferase n=1 Tax=Lygus hesperus TaxID=30085 RepID=A0A0A9ZE46_LYGHE